MSSFKNQNYNIERKFTKKDSISLNLQCTICYDVFNNPLRLNCGHTYCSSCIFDWIQKKDECPNCRQKINTNLISRDLLAFTLIEELEVSCNNDELGCPWKGHLSDLLAHLNLCNQTKDILTKRKNIVITPMKQNGIRDRKALYNSEQKSLGREYSNILVNNSDNRNISTNPGVLDLEIIRSAREYFSEQKEIKNVDENVSSISP